MKRICCRDLWWALIEHRDRLEWTPVSEDDAAGPIVVGWWFDGGFLPMHWCPYCEEAV